MIDGKILAVWDAVQDDSIYQCSEILCQKPDGKYFLYTRCECLPDSEKPISYVKAKSWVKKHCTHEVYSRIFEKEEKENA